MITQQSYLLLSIALFCIGALGAITRRDLVRIFIAVEIMMGAAGLNLVAFASFSGNALGAVFLITTWVVTVAEVMVMVAIFIYLVKRHKIEDVNELNELKW